MPIARILAGGLAVLLLTGPAVHAQKGRGGPSTQGGGPKTTAPTSHGNSNAGGGPKTTTTTSHGNPHTTTTSTTTKTHGNPHTTTSTTTKTTSTTTKTHGNPHTTTKPSSTSTAPTTSGTSTSETTTPGSSTSDTTLNPIAQKLQGKPLGARIEKMLPKGMTLDAASDGFKNQGQFIAAVHVSQNLGIPFVNLKATMLGTPLPGSTPPPGSTLPGSTLPPSTSSTTPKSLGQAIKTLRPTADASAEAQRAETQASLDVSGTSSTSTTSTSPTTSTTTAKSKKSRR